MSDARLPSPACSCVGAVACRAIQLRAQLLYVPYAGLRPSVQRTNLTITASSTEDEKNAFYRIYSQILPTQTNACGLISDGNVVNTVAEYGGAIYNDDGYLELQVTTNGFWWNADDSSLYFFEYKWRRLIDGPSGGAQIDFQTSARNAIDDMGYRKTLDRLTGAVTETADGVSTTSDEFAVTDNLPFPGHGPAPPGVDVVGTVDSGGSASIYVEGSFRATITINVPANYHAAGSAAYAVTTLIEYAITWPVEDAVAVVEDQLLDYVDLLDLTKTYKFNTSLGLPVGTGPIIWGWDYSAMWLWDDGNYTGLKWPLEPALGGASMLGGPSPSVGTPGVWTGRVVYDTEQGAGSDAILILDPPTAQGSRIILCGRARVAGNGHMHLWTAYQYPMEIRRSADDEPNDGHPATMEWIFPDEVDEPDLARVEDCVQDFFVSGGDQMLRHEDLIYAFGLGFLMREYRNTSENVYDPENPVDAFGCQLNPDWPYDCPCC